MPTTLFNPTNEELRGQYIGIDFVIPANGGKLKVEDACARHLTNFLGPRGLTTLEYEDDVEKKAEDSLARNKEFKTKQVRDYNIRNEQRKAVGLEFLIPTEQLKSYSEELGISLVEPYAMKVEGMAEVAEALKAKDKVIALLEDQVAVMNEKFDTVMEKLNTLEESGKGKKK